MPELAFNQSTLVIAGIVTFSDFVQQRGEQQTIGPVQDMLSNE